MDLPEDIAAAHASLSPSNLKFLRFVAETPAALYRRSFAALEEQNGFIPYPLQSWPTFVESRLIDDVAAANIFLCKLVHALPKRLFDGNPARLAEFYRLDPEYAVLLSHLLRDIPYMEGLLARGDFVNTASGFKCLELNMGSNLGGWKAPVWAQMYERVPLFREFLARESVRFHHRDTVQILFDHVIETARRKRLVDGMINVAFVVPPDNRSGPQVQAFAHRAFQTALARQSAPLRGEVMVCDLPDLTFENGCIHLLGKRIHALIENSDGRIDRRVFHSLLAGQLSVHNGPITDLFADKRNLALLSQHQDEPCFDEAERACIRAYMPWTRSLTHEVVDYHGQEVRLPDLLASRREDLVLKPANSSKGYGVSVGRSLSPTAWDEAVAAGLSNPDPWVVQEYVESLPYFYQCGAQGFDRHDLIWGFFAFGERYGGGFLRMMPKGGSGVVNAAQGASEGVIMETQG